MSAVSGGRRRSSGNPLLEGRQASVGLGLAVLLTIVIAVVGTIGASLGGGNNNYEVRIHFPTGNGIIEGSDVFFGGVKVGTVKTLQLDKDGKAITMTVSIGQQYAPIHEGATAAIRPKSLLGEKYVAMTVGDPAKAAYKQDATLPDSVTSVNVELDQIISIFDEPTRQQLQVLISNLGLGVAGQGRNTNETFQTGQQDLHGLAAVTDTLQTRDAELKRIIEALTKLTATLSSDQQRQTYVNLLQHSEEVLSTLKSEDANVAQGIDRMNQLFGTFDAGFSGRGADLQGTFQALPVTVTDLDMLSQNLARDGHSGYPVLQSSIPGIVSGPLIFGDLSSNPKTFTGNIWTRVETTVGCFFVNQRTKDPATGAYSDNGPPISTPRAAPYTLQSVASPAFTALCDSGAAGTLGAVLSTICTGVPPNPVTGAVCSATGHAATAASPSGSSSSGSAPRSQGAPGAGGSSGLAPVPTPPPGSDQAQQDLLRYLLH